MEISPRTVPIRFFLPHQSIQKLLQAFHGDKGLQPQTPPCKISQVCFTVRSLQLEVEPALDHLSKDLKMQKGKVEEKKKGGRGKQGKKKRKQRKGEGNHKRR